MDIIFLGYMVPLEKMNQYSGISVAGNKMQYNIMNELNKLSDVTVHSVSMLPHACYPRDKHMYVGKKKYEYNGIKCSEVAYLNLPIIKQVTQIISVYKEAKNILKRINKQENDVVVMGFNIFPQVGIPMKKLRKHTKIICVLADLPIDDATNRKGFSKLLRKLFDSSTIKNMKVCNDYVVLSEYVKKDYLGDKNVIVIEGGISQEDIETFEEVRQDNKKTIILYSGALSEYNGVGNLIEAMKYLESNDIELRIYGDGYLKEFVVQSQSEDNRIKYCGQVSNAEMKKYQCQADILVNPRQINNRISRYTFPSKTFEYFLSKTIVVSTRIPSYPQEYLDKMILAEDSPAGFAKAIEKVIDMPCDKKREIEDRAYNFVVTEKKWSVQIRKIITWIKGI